MHYWVILNMQHVQRTLNWSTYEIKYSQYKIFQLKIYLHS